MVTIMHRFHILLFSQDTCVSLARLVQDTANANLDILMGVSEESVEEVDECLGIVQLMLVCLIKCVRSMCLLREVKV